MRYAIFAALAALIAAPVSADGFAKISKRADFVSLIDGKDLKRFGIKLNVMPDGQITGDALGAKCSAHGNGNKAISAVIFTGDRATSAPIVRSSPYRTAPSVSSRTGARATTRISHSDDTSRALRARAPFRHIA